MPEASDVIVPHNFNAFRYWMFMSKPTYTQEKRRVEYSNKLKVLGAEYHGKIHLHASIKKMWRWIITIIMEPV